MTPKCSCKAVKRRRMSLPPLNGSSSDEDETRSLPDKFRDFSMDELVSKLKENLFDEATEQKLFESLERKLVACRENY